MIKLVESILKVVAPSIHSTKLKAGDTAPEFSGKDQNGKFISLKDLRGGKVVLYFYPKDDTMGCTAEACNLRDNYHLFLKRGYTVVGVSPDDEASHAKFGAKNNLPFSLLADTDLSIATSYDVWGRKSILGKKYDGMLRTTFVIDEAGIISEVISDVTSGDHAEQILK